MRDVNYSSRRVFIWPMEWIVGGMVVLAVIYLVLRYRRAKIIVEKR